MNDRRPLFALLLATAACSLPPSAPDPVTPRADAGPVPQGDADASADSGPADSGPADSGPADSGPADAGAWTLVWADEFDGPTIDTQNWVIDNWTPDKNNELQAYTNRTGTGVANSYIENGVLVLEARAEAYEKRNYTSGSVETKGLREFQYGRFEARMKLPDGNGMWPAFWLLGTNIGTVDWPSCGEIDVVEGKGRVPNWISSALHRGASGADNPATSTKTLSSPPNFHDAWHVFAMEWDSQRIRFLLDDALFYSKGKDGTGVQWPFDQKFYLILNLAVDGQWFDPQAAVPPNMSPQRMFIDYVRVYKKS